MAAPIVASVLAEAKKTFCELQTIERQLLLDRDRLLDRAWLLGKLLSKLKGNVGHGKWLMWLPANFPELGSSDSARTENAARCIRFYKRNLSNIGNSRYLRPKEFTTESVRKLMWGYVPVKERPQLEGNRKVPESAHYLTFINNFAKFDRQVQIGLIPLPPQNVMRRECESTVRRLADLLGRDWIKEILGL